MPGRDKTNKQKEALNIIKGDTNLGNIKKPKIVTPAMIKAKGFTTLRDYLNNEKNLKRRDGKKVKRTTDTSGNKTTLVQPPIRAPKRSGEKIVSSLASSRAGVDAAPGVNKVKKIDTKVKKKKTFLEKTLKEIKRNFGPGKNKLVTKGTSNIIGNKNFVSDKKKKRKLPKQLST